MSQIERTKLPENLLCAGVIKGTQMVMAVNEDLVSEDEVEEFRASRFYDPIAYWESLRRYWATNWGITFE